MALVRVYCGLASADPAERPVPTGSTLTSAVVDDAGRLLDVCEITDDPTGYARLGALLVERSGGPSDAAIAADSDDHTVTALLSAAGRPLAIADDDSVDDFAERFADDDSTDEMQSAAAERRAVGLARALQAGALSAVTLPPPRDLASFRPVLAAHAALAGGRHSAAVALREVLRELYPAALRAYPDPAEPISLAVLDALPEPSMLAGATVRGSEASAATDAVAAHLVADGVADADTINNAVTALRVAISETPRRATINRALTSAVAETVRQAVAAVQACDSGCAALVATLSARAAAPAAVPEQRSVRRNSTAVAALPAPASGVPAPTPARSGLPTRSPGQEPVPSGGRLRRPEPIPGSGVPTSPQPVAPPPVAPRPVAAPPVAPAAAATPIPAPSSGPPAPGQPATHRGEGPTNSPVSAPPPPPGITPIPPSQRGKIPPAEAGEPFRATLTTAAINSVRAERQRPTPIPPRAKTRPDPAPSAREFSATSVPVPAPRSGPEGAPPGSRANWPLVSPADDRVERAGNDPAAYPRSSVDAPTDPGAGEGRVTPPWLADDLPPEPPMLRLVEPPPLADRALQDTGSGSDTPPLRLVEQGGPVRTQAPVRTPRAEQPERPAAAHRPPPVVDDGDRDLLIFAAARSAWFTDQADGEADWSTTADTGWRAAEQAARPAVGAETRAGLPRRVPKANLVPGSPLREERPLRIVRNPASLAENTTGYFQGWRRGQEIGGFAVGGRPGRELAGGWDFSRDHDDRDDDREYEYRSAGYRS